MSPLRLSVFIAGQLSMSVLRDVVYLDVGVATFRWAIRHARTHGKLLQMWE